MPAERLSMRKVREVLRLTYACRMSARLVARSLGIGRTVVGDYIRRAHAIGITWPVPAEFGGAQIPIAPAAPPTYPLRGGAWIRRPCGARFTPILPSPDDEIGVCRLCVLETYCPSGLIGGGDTHGNAERLRVAFGDP